ncbi:NADH-quinone oxidoreductase subunit C [Streptomyces sp. NPDC001288]|uniref:NADH-quinone oxidoreductase subunit C n=1 Tax=Streptomyces sp. NPDC001297 TaxID=3364559 RepID=UPI0036989BD4
MTAPAGWLPAPVDELFGPDATAEESYEVLTVDVPPSSWLTALDTARTALGCTFFDWMSAVDEPGTGFRVSAHLVALAPVRRLLLRTTVPHSAAELPSAVGVYAGARWHERETHEMFGVRFSGHPGLDHLLLPETFEGHPLRKDFVLAARVAKAWPGAKEPGESDHAGPRRRQMLPPGVPDPNDWGPQKGQLPPAPARPARAAAGRPAGDRPVRRSRTAAEGSAGRTTDETPPTTPTPTPEPTPTGTEPMATPRRGRSASEGSASQRTVPGEQAPPAATRRRGRSASEGSASQRAVSAAGESSAAGEGAAGESAAKDQTAAGGSAAGGEAAEAAEPTAAAPRGPRRARTASGGSASQRAQDTAPASDPATPARPAMPRSPDAPWHHARPAFDEPGPEEQRPDTTTEATEPTTPSGSTEPTTPSGSTEPTGPTGSEPVAPAPPAVPEEGEASEASEGAGSESARSDADDSDAPPGPGAAPEERPGRPTPREDRPGGPQ